MEVRRGELFNHKGRMISLDQNVKFSAQLTFEEAQLRVMKRLKAIIPFE